MSETDQSGDITQMLDQWRRGEATAGEKLMRLLYPELERLAASQLRGNRRSETLNTRVLVNEAYEKLVRGDAEVANRRHFMALAAKVMRQVIVDYARRRTALRRGGDAVHYNLDDLQLSVSDNPEEILMLSEVLDQLKALGEPFVQVVECRYFAGMTLEETAEALDISRRSVQRYWSRARLWLRKGLKESGAVED